MACTLDTLKDVELTIFYHYGDISFSVYSSASYLEEAIKTHNRDVIDCLISLPANGLVASNRALKNNQEFIDEDNKRTIERARKAYMR